MKKILCPYLSPFKSQLLSEGRISTVVYRECLDGTKYRIAYDKKSNLYLVLNPMSYNTFKSSYCSLKEAMINMDNNLKLDGYIFLSQKRFDKLRVLV